ncbi:hypothetical protein M9Y10_022997 [Tritrichomonas musculus]|uniref:Protein kinase domain-containing protein n=1 Tax=Tritrichomonas musculus TaxID=1915356 RepID=A0ABR2KTW2_9EUKA
MNMIEEFQKIQKFVGNKIELQNKAANEVVKDYNFIHISDPVSFEQKEEESKIYQNIDNSEVIVINQNQKNDQSEEQKYYYIGFEKTIILLEESSLSFLQKLLSSHPTLPICLLTNKDDCFSKSIKNPEIIINEFIKDEIDALSESFYLSNVTKTMRIIWQYIVPCISTYLLKKSYSESSNYRISNYLLNIEKPIETNVIKKDQYADLGNIGNGSSFTCKLIYHILHGKLYVIKNPFGVSSESPKLIKREKENYLRFRHPLLPAFIGTVEETDCIVIEYIYGQTLDNIKQMQLTPYDVFHIICEICLIIKYFHSNNYIYRDLKPNNIIIDKNKTAVLIDLDRLIQYDPSCEHTSDLNKASNNPSFEDDIQCLGNIINFILTETEKIFNITNEMNKAQMYSKIKQISEQCLNIKPKPSISDIIDKIKIQDGNIFYYNIFKLLNYLSEKNQKSRNDMITYYCLGFIYCTGYHVPIDISKSIHYYKLAASKNHVKAYYRLGVIYDAGHHVPVDIEKAIYYYSLASNQNYVEAQFRLGYIYDAGHHVPVDIDKAIHYYSLASNQNYAEAQYMLGDIYDKGRRVSVNINKAIHYYSLASNQNHVKAYYRLGVIYDAGHHVPVDIDKAIYYYSLASNQNYVEAQFRLGYIYDAGHHVPVDIDKAIHYYSLASNQNYAEAQYMLGDIYDKGRRVSVDINKAIHYYTLAANQNHKEALYSLGVIYDTGRQVSVDINKAIHYYTLAANQNNIYAKLRLGSIYFKGHHVPVDINKGIHYYSLAMNQNDEETQHMLEFIYDMKRHIPDGQVPNAFDEASHTFSNFANEMDAEYQYTLGIIYEIGQNVPVDINKAIHHLSLAANQNHVLAQLNLAVIYYQGRYVPIDIDKAIHYLSLAADQNNANAQHILGLIYNEGYHVPIDINKAIHYYSLSANQNYAEAQYRLGAIYEKGQNVPVDINKAIHYYSLAANQNHTEAQYRLGIIYSKNDHASFDIGKAIHYLSLAANQNYAEAQYSLGAIYEKGQNVPVDINKAIHYYSLAANQSHAEALFRLGYNYTDYSSYDIDKAIHYFSLAANQDHAEAQFYLGIIYYFNNISITNMKKSILNIILSSKKGHRAANFAHGFLLLEGNYVKRDIREAVHYLKEASSFNNQFAKNNLGILYKHGFEPDVTQRIGQAIEYFEEAIRQKDDYLSMYNLSHIYFYDQTIKQNFNPLDLLIKSSRKFNESFVLLCLLLIHKFGSDIEQIRAELERREDESNCLFSQVISYIKKHNLFDQKAFDRLYNIYRERDYLYNVVNEPILTSEIRQKDKKTNKPKYPNMKEISQEFYEGFGRDLMQLII